MKYIFLIISLLFLNACGSPSTGVLILSAIDKSRVEQEISMDSITGAYMQLSSSRYDFGEIRKKKTPHISINFEIKNVGKAPLEDHYFLTIAQEKLDTADVLLVQVIAHPQTMVVAIYG